MNVWENLNRKDIWILGAIMILAIGSRAIYIGKYPVGIHVDEAYAGYEAYSLLKYGMDSWGYRNPVYLTTWGSGMSALESYLMMPFILAGGLNSYTIRIPQMVMGIVSVLVLHLLIKKICNNQMALWAGFLLATCPWHIMMSRWGLDANLAPAFILLGIYFGVLGLEKGKYMIISALFWGLSLYSYALMWIFVPFFLLASFIYCRKFGKIKITKSFLCAIGVLVMIALPLLLFVAVNIGMIPEVATRYISIPKLIEFRSDELTFSNILANARDLVRLYITQNDYNLMHSTPYFGMYYLFSMPFIIIGAGVCVRKIIHNVKNKLFGYEFFLVCWLILCVIIGLMRSISVYRANCMNLAVLILEVIGISWLCQKIQKRWVKKSLVSIYIISFCLFELYYFSSYQNDIKDIQRVGMDDALAYALELKADYGVDKIHITNGIAHPQVLFYLDYPTDSFISTIAWKNYPAKWVYAESFGCFVWDIKDDADEIQKGIYIISSDDMETYQKAGYHVAQFEEFAVAEQ